MMEVTDPTVESRLKSLAPELRNTIADLALATDREDGYTDITKPWPSITQVDTQMRTETYDMFLAATDFIAHIKVENGSYDRLLRWLDMLGDKVHLVKSLTIVSDSMWELGSDSTWFGETFGVVGLWTYMGTQLQQRGLTASQLRLPNMPDDTSFADLRNNPLDIRDFARAVTWHRHYLAIIARAILRSFELFEEDRIQRAEADLLMLLREKIAAEHILDHIVWLSDTHINSWLNIHEVWQKYAGLTDEQEKKRLLEDRRNGDRSDFTRWKDSLDR